jgi:hypothetical protein
MAARLRRFREHSVHGASYPRIWEENASNEDGSSLDGFTWPQLGDAQGKVVLSHEELSLLLGGIDLTKTKHKRWYRKAPPEGNAAA